MIVLKDSGEIIPFWEIQPAKLQSYYRDVWAFFSSYMKKQVFSFYGSSILLKIFRINKQTKNIYFC